MRYLDRSEAFLNKIEDRLREIRSGRKPFSEFLEEKMDVFDYSNTSLARKVYHRIEKKDSAEVSYLPVTRQTIGAWLKGSMPSSREIYVTLGMAFSMSLEEINHVLLETYMGYGLYSKNIEDALWIAMINGLFPIEEFEQVKSRVEEIIQEPDREEPEGRLATMDLWTLLSDAGSLSQFYEITRTCRAEFRDGVRSFGLCLEEVIEEEYGYYEKASWFLRDIGLLHCEAQFSKIRAGKAVVTREWLLRFLIALQPSIASIEKLLAKAQMEPLGITPSEIILATVAEDYADSLANSQEMWCLIESAASVLRKKGYELEDDLCRKYDSAWQIPVSFKWLFSLCLGQEILNRQSHKDYGYEKEGYCRYTFTDRLLFEDMNRIKKGTAFKKMASRLWESRDLNPASPGPDSTEALGSLDFSPALTVPRKYQADIVDLEKFEDYCYMRKPSRFSRNFQMNDLYFYCALLYSLWTGKCWRKDFGSGSRQELADEFDRLQIKGDEFLRIMEENLRPGSVWKEENDISQLMKALWMMKEMKASDVKKAEALLIPEKENGKNR